MISSVFSRYAIGYSAFRNDAFFKEISANHIFELGEKIIGDYEKKGAQFDVDFSDDALSLTIKGNTFLLNRQTPTRQLWLSSPISGSHKFDFDTDKGQWVDHENHGIELNGHISKEIESLL